MSESCRNYEDKTVTKSRKSFPSKEKRLHLRFQFLNPLRRQGCSSHQESLPVVQHELQGREKCIQCNFNERLVIYEIGELKIYIRKATELNFHQKTCRKQ